MPLGAVGEPGGLAGLCQWHRLEEFRAERVLRAGAFGRGPCGGIEPELCLENWVGLDRGGRKRKRRGLHFHWGK